MSLNSTITADPFRRTGVHPRFSVEVNCLVFCVVFCEPLFFFTSLFFQSLHCLFYFDLWLRITLLISSNFLKIKMMPALY